MIASLPLSAWLLLIATIVLPLSIEITYFLIHRRARQQRVDAAARGTDGRAGR